MRKGVIPHVLYFSKCSEYRLSLSKMSGFYFPSQPPILFSLLNIFEAELHLLSVSIELGWNLKVGVRELSGSCHSFGYCRLRCCDGSDAFSTSLQWSSRFIKQYLKNKNCRYSRYTLWWFYECIPCERTDTCFPSSYKVVIAQRTF